MGHKVHPISLRLPGLRAWDSSWYTDRHYSALFLYDHAMRAYLTTLYASIQVLPGRILSHVYPKSHVTYAVTHAAYGSSSPRSQTAGVRAHRKATPIAHFVTQGSHPRARMLLAHWHALHTRHMAPHSENAFLPLYAQKRPDVSPVRVLRGKDMTVTRMQEQYTQAPLKSALEACASTQSGMTTQMLGLQAQSLFQSAAFLAQYIAHGLESKKSVRFLWARILQEEKRGVHGIRILCAGRLGGAEMAKVESRKWGQTPLQTFDQKVDFSQATARTTFGLLGVKVWVCYAS